MTVAELVRAPGPLDVVVQVGVLPVQPLQYLLIDYDVVWHDCSFRLRSCGAAQGRPARDVDYGQNAAALLRSAEM